jgi:hypothetical protein
VLPPRGSSGFKIYYHQLFVDRRHTLYGCMSMSLMDGSGIYPRILIDSDDHGRTWQLVRTGAVQDRLVEPWHMEAGVNRME